ncbi:MAG: DUF1736 domain-containing protein [Chitinophagia bacterium]|nr:DUF1736 domain-containing protein [Chitinophagia bacterium]
MAKKQNNRPSGIVSKTTTANSATATSPDTVNTAVGPVWLQFRFQAIFLALLSMLLYANTFSHEYAFDDMMAIVNNEYVQEGVSGIGKIMTTDAYQSYLEQHNGANQLAGGRYRPLSLVSFAIEQQVLGINENTTDKDGQPANRTPEQEQKLNNDMHVRHFINVALYALCVVVLLQFLRKIVFPSQPVAAFAGALLFAIHPLHTEVVANVKSRDEILSILLICLTYLRAFRYRETSDKKYLYHALLCFFLALLSKEYAITTIALLPLAFYVFGNDDWATAFKRFLPYLIPLGVYFLLRVASVNGPAEGAEKDIMNNPYVNATTVQRLATEILVLGMYVKLLLFPHPLTADYSFNQIPYTDFSNPMVIGSLLLYIAIVVAIVVTGPKRNKIAFALGFYLLHLLLISNIFFNIGAPMGERLAFHSSIGFVILAGMAIDWLYNRLQPEKNAQIVMGGALLVVVFLSGFKVMTRNEDWKNNITLFMQDVKTSPNSVLANTNAGSSCMANAKKTNDSLIRRQYMLEAITYFDKALTIYPGHDLARINRGLCQFNTGSADKALTDWSDVRRKGNNHPNLGYYLTRLSQYYYAMGAKAVSENRIPDAVIAFTHADSAAHDQPAILLNLGGVLQASGNVAGAKEAYAHCLRIDPNNNEARVKLSSLGGN